MSIGRRPASFPASPLSSVFAQDLTLTPLSTAFTFGHPGVPSPLFHPKSFLFITDREIDPTFSLQIPPSSAPVRQSPPALFWAGPQVTYFLPFGHSLSPLFDTRSLFSIACVPFTLFQGWRHIFHRPASLPQVLVPNWNAAKWARQRREAWSYFTWTVGSTDMPGRSKCSGSWPFSKTIFTGMRWTTLT